MYYTTKTAAAYLGLDPSRVRQLCESGRLRALKFGRDWAINRDDLVRYQKPKRGRPRKKC